MTESLKELANERAAIDLMIGRLMDAKKANVVRMQAALDAADKDHGQDRVTASLPSGEDVATITLRKGAVGPVITNEAELIEWIKATFSEEQAKDWIEVKVVKSVKPWKAAELVAQMDALGLSMAPKGEPMRQAQWAGEETQGTFVDVPGVHIKPTSARTHARTWKKGGEDKLIAAYLSGELTDFVRRALAPAQDADTEGGAA